MRRNAGSKNIFSVEILFKNNHTMTWLVRHLKKLISYLLRLFGLRTFNLNFRVVGITKSYLKYMWMAKIPINFFLL